MEREAKRAYISWMGQRRRCYNPKNSRYPWYGAKGIEVQYTAREFIAWWLHEIKRKKRWKRPSCGRIDHEKNYTLDNIELVECADNSREARARKTREEMPVRILAYGPDDLILVFSNYKEVCRVTGSPKALLVAHLAGEAPSPVAQLVFKYGDQPKPA